MEGPVLRRALGYLAPHRARLVLVAAAGMASTVLALALPYLSKALVDRALLGRDTRALVAIVLSFAGLAAASFALNVASGLAYTRLSADVLFAMRLDVYRHLQRLSPRYYARTRLGEIVSRLNADVAEIQRASSELVLGWLGNIVFLLGSLALMVWIDVRLFALSIVPLPVAVWALARYRRRLEVKVGGIRQASADVGSFLIETLRGAKLVAVSNAAAREQQRFARHNDRFVSALMDMQRVSYFAGGVPSLVLMAGTAAVFWYGGVRVIRGDLTLGALVAFVAYQMRLLGPVQGLLGLWTNLATVRVSLARVQALLDEAPDVVEAPLAEPLERVGGEIRFERVGFSFDREPVLVDASFCVRPGETVALVGASGSGKSTIADLIARLLDPDAGRVLVDGRDLKTVRLADLRREVALVDQEPFLFHATIAENVRYARPDAPDTDVESALRAAGLEAVVRSLPRGLQTVVGEDGAALSAGERQRLAVARALLADPSVLVLDEPSASLDPESERRLLTGWRDWMRGRTVIVITHRAEVAKQADRVIRLEGARVWEEPSLLTAAGPDQ